MESLSNVFQEYITYFYDKKRTATNSTERSTAKGFLNKLIGRFGLKLFRTKSKIYYGADADLIKATRKIVFATYIGNDAWFIVHGEKVDEKITTSFGLDYVEVINRFGDFGESSNTFTNVCVAIPAAVNAYARIIMNETKLDILKGGGNIYYTDTDSIVTDKPLPNHLVGEDIGQFKLEHRIKKGYFISNKTYCIVDDKDKVIIKSKGVNPKSLTLKDFQDMFEGVSAKALKTYSTKDYALGSVTIDTEMITLDPQSFKKRIKIYGGNNVWSDTYPI
jgi:hypothetical protein